jgi:hypothetical protein
MMTNKGLSTLDKVLRNDIKNTWKLSSETRVNVEDRGDKIRTTYHLGDTKQGNSDPKDNYGGKVNPDGTLGIKEETTTVYIGTINAAIKDKTDLYSGLTTDEGIGAVAGHELTHGNDKSEINKDIKYAIKTGGKSVRSDQETNPQTVEKQIISEIRSQKQQQ